MFKMIKDMQDQINALQEKQSADISVATPSTSTVKFTNPMFLLEHLTSQSLLPLPLSSSKHISPIPKTSNESPLSSSSMSGQKSERSF